MRKSERAVVSHRGSGTGGSRRKFLHRLGRGGAGAACMVLSPWVSGCAAFPRVSPAWNGSLVRISLLEFESTDGVLFDFPTEGMPVYVHRHMDDRFTAVLTRCAHKGCEVEPNADRIVCPCHGSEYRHDGALIEGPADAPLISYRVEVVGEFLTIDVSRGRRLR